MAHRFLAVATALVLTAGLGPPSTAHAATALHQRAKPPVERAAPPATQRAQPAVSQPVGHIPCDLYNAYDAWPTAASDDGAGQTIAVIDPYGTSTVVQDFTSFSQAFNLGGPALMTKQPFGVDMTQPDAPPNTTWIDEIPLGVEWAHALAPAAQVVLVEARTSLDSDMINAIDYAVNQLNADIVNMSWTFDESGYDQAKILSWDSHFPATNGAGNPITFFAATGDSGKIPAWPAVSPQVVGVGGTTVTATGFAGDDTTSHTTCPAAPAPPYAPGNETAWAMTGGGASAYEPQPAYQSGIAPGPNRDTPDVAMLGDPNDGVAVFEAGSWSGGVLGGSSLSTPMWAALTSRLNQGKQHNLSNVSWLYWAYTATPAHTGFNDVAPPGYDTSTGLGTPLFEELKPEITNPVTSYFPWFDRISDPAIVGDNIHVVNPNATDTRVVVNIPGCGPLPQATISAGQERIFTCSNGYGGPVTVSASQRVVASQRVQYGQSFNEVKAQPSTAAATAIVFTWYDHVSDPGFLNGRDDIHVVNPSPATANVTVTIPGCAPIPFAIPAGQDHPFTCATGYGGPVTVSANQPVLASQRVKYYGSFNEVPGLAAGSGSSSLWLSWYDHVSDPGFKQGRDDVHVVNPNSTGSANVSVNIPGCSPFGPVPVPAGQDQVFTCANGFGGPVHVTTDGANVLATQRVKYYQTFNEVAAQSIGDAGSALWIPWYDLASSPGFTSDNIHVLNPGPNPVHNYQVSIPGCSVQPPNATGDLAVGIEIVVSCPGAYGGPVQITASGPLLAAARVKYYSSFNEVTGSP